MSIAPLDLAWASRARVEDTSRALAEPDWLLAERREALDRLVDLPAEPNQLFTPYHDLRAVDFGAIEPYGPREVSEGESDAAVPTGAAAVPPGDAGLPPGDAALPRGDTGLPTGAAALVHVHQDRLVTRALGPEASAAGVVITTLEEAAQEQPHLVRSFLEGGGSLPADDAFAQVPRALASLGIVIHVPDGVTLEQPIVLRWSLGEPGFGLVARTVVTLGRDAHASIFEEQLGAADGGATDGSLEAPRKATSMWWGTTEILLGDGATLDFAGEQDFGPATAAFVTRQARTGKDATINWAIASVGARMFRSRIENLLEGRGSSVQQVEIGFGDGNQLFDLTSYTRHRGEHTTSDLLSKGIFSGTSRGYIKGMIEIARSARGTDTFLGEFSMLLERSARSVTVPSLEIDQPDVRRAMHSSSVAPIDEGQVFYLMTRGLSRDAARKAIVLGFLEPVVARIPLPAAQDRLRGLLERKWPEGAQDEAAA